MIMYAAIFVPRRLPAAGLLAINADISGLKCATRFEKHVQFSALT